MNIEAREPIYIELLVLERNEDDEEDTILQKYNLNFSDLETKMWMTRTFTWAMKNDKIIEMSPLKDISDKYIWSPPGKKEQVN